MIKEGADYGFEKTHDIGDRGRGDGYGRSAPRVCSAGWARRSDHVFL
jgi:hypothetical protein